MEMVFKLSGHTGMPAKYDFDDPMAKKFQANDVIPCHSRTTMSTLILAPWYQLVSTAWRFDRFRLGLLLGFLIAPPLGLCTLSTQLCSSLRRTQRAHGLTQRSGRCMAVRHSRISTCHCRTSSLPHCNSSTLPSYSCGQVKLGSSSRLICARSIALTHE